MVGPRSEQVRLNLPLSEHLPNQVTRLLGGNAIGGSRTIQARQVVRDNLQKNKRWVVVFALFRLHMGGAGCGQREGPCRITVVGRSPSTWRWPVCVDIEILTWQQNTDVATPKKAVGHLHGDEESLATLQQKRKMAAGGYRVAEVIIKGKIINTFPDSVNITNVFAYRPK